MEISKLRANQLNLVCPIVFCLLAFTLSFFLFSGDVALHPKIITPSLNASSENIQFKLQARQLLARQHNKKISRMTSSYMH